MIEEGRHYGKFRGTVLNNIDPMKMGRLQLQVPDVQGLLPTSWALPAAPAGGIQSGAFLLPAIGAGVWVEFEHGNADYPIWTGCWWGSAAEMPALAAIQPPGLQSFVFQTTLQNALVISDAPGPAGGILIKSTTGAMIMVNDVGITITNGKGASIVMVGPTITINQGAMVIT